MKLFLWMILLKSMKLNSIADTTVSWIQPNDNSVQHWKKSYSTSLFNFCYLSFILIHEIDGAPLFRTVYCLIPTRKTFYFFSNDINSNFVNFNIKWINAVTIRPSSGILIVFSSFYRIWTLICVFVYSFSP